MTEYMSKFNLRTGHHSYTEGEVYGVNDGPDFLGYFQCVRDPETGELVEVGATKDEYYAYLESRRHGPVDITPPEVVRQPPQLPEDTERFLDDETLKRLKSQ